MLARLVSGARAFSRRATTPVMVHQRQWMSSTAKEEEPPLVEEELEVSMQEVDFIENLRRLPAVLRKRRSKIFTIKDTAGKEYHIKLPYASELKFEVEFEKDDEECELEFSIKWKPPKKKNTPIDYSSPKKPSPIEDIEGVGPKSGSALREHGITTTQQLFSKVKAEGAAALSKSTAISEDTLIKFSQIADLMQIKLAGFKSTGELAAADPERLLAACKEVMERRPTLNKLLLGSKWASKVVEHADAFVQGSSAADKEQ